jgi:hypothetical protein
MPLATVDCHGSEGMGEKRDGTGAGNAECDQAASHDAESCLYAKHQRSLQKNACSWIRS